MGCPLRVIVVAITIAIASICLLFSMCEDEPKKKVSLLDLNNKDETECDEETENEKNSGIFQQIAAIMTGKALLDQYCSSHCLSEAETKATEAAFASIWKRPSVVTALLILHVGVIIGFRICPYFGATVAAFGILLACLVEFFSTLQIKPPSGCPHMSSHATRGNPKGNPKTKCVATQTDGNKMFSADELSKHNGLTKPTIYVSRARCTMSAPKRALWSQWWAVPHVGG